ncbi:uncharacterized protein TNCV_2072871 [Trichonephila clavipes]|nr:uncharacterized protein TNCV_2072871 [Trichonephila clavipes]
MLCINLGGNIVKSHNYIGKHEWKVIVALYVSSQGRYIWFPHFRHGKRAMNMNQYTNAELADIQFIYGLAKGNGRVAFRLYGERYLTRWQLNHQTLARVHQNLVEHGSFRALLTTRPSILKWTWWHEYPSLLI